MSPDIEHMLTNISLWFSSKPCGDFLLQSPNPQETRIIRIKNFDYNKAREDISNYLQTLGTIDNIQYNHEDDCYEIYILKEDKEYSILRTYTLLYTANTTIEV